MSTILVAGTGKIGRTIAHLLAAQTSYQVIMGDLYPHDASTIILDAADPVSLSQQLKDLNADAVVACLPYFLTRNVAKAARSANCHYFDLTEDIESSEAIAALAANSEYAFIPQCGLAPGFINIIANHLMSDFNSLDTVKLRCGALPQTSSHALHYALTWSTAGLINEYGNDSRIIEDGAEKTVSGLSGLETLRIDGADYEAFNTSGGVGTLIDTYKNRVKHLSYKTIRYPGHCEKMRLLLFELRLNEQREMFANILENALPATFEDVVIITVSVSGELGGEFLEKTFNNKFYPQNLSGLDCSAIQATTASSVCVIVDTVLQNPTQYRGFIKQEDFNLAKFLNNRFAIPFQTTSKP